MHGLSKTWTSTKGKVVAKLLANLTLLAIRKTASDKNPSQQQLSPEFARLRAITDAAKTLSAFSLFSIATGPHLCANFLLILTLPTELLQACRHLTPTGI